MSWYIKVWKNAFNFNGRAQRSEYWFFVLFNFIAGLVLGFADGILIAALEVPPVLGTLYSLAAIIPSIAVGVRRLHDIGKSGWMMLLGLIPCIGTILLIVWFCQDSEADANDYGPNPKALG